MSLLHRYAFISSLILFLCSGRNLLFRLISHPIYGAAILLNPFNLLLAFYTLSVSNVLTCLLTIFCVFFLSTIYPHFCYTSVSPSPNLPHLTECDSNPRKIPPIFTTLSSVLKDMARTIGTQRCIDAAEWEVITSSKQRQGGSQDEDARFSTNSRVKSFGIARSFSGCLGGAFSRVDEQENKLPAGNVLAEHKLLRRTLSRATYKANPQGVQNYK